MINWFTPAGLLRRLRVWVGNALIGERTGVQFQAGPGIQISGADDSGNDRVALTIGRTDGGMAVPLPGLPMVFPPGLLENDTIVVPYALGATAPATFTSIAESIYWIPWIATTPVAISRVAVNVVTSASGSSVAIGLYESAPATFYAPTNQLFMTSAIDSATTGLKPVSVAWSIPAGVYWIAVLVTGGAPVLRAVAQASARTLVMPSLGTAAITMWRTPGSALPSTAPITGYSGMASTLPAVGMTFTFSA